MPIQRIIFVRTPLGLGLIILLLLGLGVAGPAMALQFDTFSLSAFILPPSAATFGFTETRVTITAYPDIQLSVAFNGANPSGRSVLLCSTGVSIPYGLPCSPGDHVFAAALSGNVTSTNGSFGSFSIGSFGSCNAGGFPLRIPPLVGSDRCGNFSAEVSFAPVVLPPFTGTTEITVESAFSASAGATLRYFDGPFSNRVIFVDHVGGSGSGRGEFDLVWQADKQAWLPLRAEGHIAATPEPATLLLFGTTAAGLGRARRYRRRTQGHQDAA